MTIKKGNFFVVICMLAFLFVGSPDIVSADGVLAINSVTPQTVYNDLDTLITVEGSQFTDVIRVALNNTELTDLNILNDQTLTAVIPWGMTPGTYTLNVYSAEDSASKDSAVTIELGIGEWISNGPYGGQVSQILQDPVNTDRIFVVVTGVGIFRSVDHGENWEFVFATDMGSLAMDAVDPDLLYVTKTNEGLYRSQDGGDHWEAIPFTDIPQISVVFPFTHPTQGNTVFAGLYFSDDDYDDSIEFGIYKSTDAGQNWVHVSEGIPNEKKITSMSFGGDYIYAGTDDGLIYRGSTGGTTWAETTVDWSGESVIHINELKIQPGTTDLFVITQGDGFSGPMFRCEEVDSGEEISLTCAILEVDNPYFDSTDPAVDIQFNPTDPNDILIAYSKPARSTDNGVTWNVYSDDTAPFQSEAVMFDLSDSTTIFSSNIQGLFRNSNAASYDSVWEKVVEGMTGLIPNYIAVSADQPQSIYANPSGAGLFHSSDGGVTWEQLPSVENEGGNQYTPNLPVAVDCSNDDYIIIANWSNAVFISLDGGLTWQESEELTIPEPYSDYTFAFRFLEPIPNAPHQFLAGGYLIDPETQDNNQAPAGAIYRLELDGTTATWTELLIEASLGRIQNVVFDPDDPGKIYCASYTKGGDGYALHSALVYSEDNGENWDILTPPGSEFDGYHEINTIAISPSTGILLVDGGNNILSIDSETNAWQVYSNIPGNSSLINRLLFAPALGSTPETLYAATMQGLYQSIDCGQTWTYVSSNFIGVNVTALKYISLSDTQGIVYSGVVGGLLEAMGGESLGRDYVSSTDSLVEGGVYHLTRTYSEYYLYMPLFQE